MGVSKPKCESRAVRIEDLIEGANGQPEINYADYLFDSDLESIAEEDGGEVEDNRNSRANLPQAATPRRREQKKLSSSKAVKAMRRFDEANAVSLQYHKRMGARKKLRIETYHLIASLAEPEDVRYDASDIFEETMTAFARLLADEEGMRMWNEFVEKDEKEQRRFLREIDAKSGDEDGKQKRAAVVPKTSGNGITAKDDGLRAVHPAYTPADVCFSRMDKRFKRELLRGRNVPYSFIEKMELRLREFFTEAQGAVYVEQLASKFKRFYLHATAQYLMLKSQSISGDGEEAGMVEISTKKGGTFVPPEGLLVEFVRSKRRSSCNYREKRWES